MITILMLLLLRWKYGGSVYIGNFFALQMMDIIFTQIILVVLLWLL